MKVETSEERLLNELESYFTKAEKEGKWFYSPYQNLWFSPIELRELQSEGRFIWGKGNWELRNPQERIEELEKLKTNIEKQIIEFKARIEVKR